MQKLSKIVIRPNKRLGRGIGSGKGGHTSGRGQKGQKSRGKIGILFEGYKMKKSFIKRLPLQRGKGKFHSKGKAFIVTLDKLSVLPSGSTVDLALLIEEKIITKEIAVKFGVKILSGGKIAKKLTVMVPVSASAAREIEMAGGKVGNK